MCSCWQEGVEGPWCLTLSEPAKLLTVDMLDAEPAALESGWQPRPVEGGECALFRIVRGLGEPWDATGQRDVVAFYSDESCGVVGLFSDARVRLESRKHWE